MASKGGSMANAGLMAALSYSVISIAITLFNKAVLSSYGFDSSMTLTLLQGLITVICLEFMKWRRLIDFPNFDWATARKVAPLSFVFIAYVVISLISLGRVNVPMFTALRRTTIVFVMIEEYYMLGITPSRAVMNSVIVMCLGAAIAAWKDLSFDIVSYAYLTLTNLFTSLYTVYINVVKKDTGLNIWAMLYYNNVTTMPALAILAWYTGDIQRAWSFKHARDPLFQVNFQASIFLAFLLNVATFYCTTLNSARTQTVVGQLKNFFAFLLGLVLFNDYIYDPINFAGLIVGFLGGVQYSWVTYVERLQGKAAAPAPVGDKAGGDGSGKVAAGASGGGASNGGGAGDVSITGDGGASAARLRVAASPIATNGGGGGGSGAVAQGSVPLTPSVDVMPMLSDDSLSQAGGGGAAGSARTSSKKRDDDVEGGAMSSSDTIAADGSGGGRGLLRGFAAGAYNALRARGSTVGGT